MSRPSAGIARLAVAIATGVAASPGGFVLAGEPAVPRALARLAPVATARADVAGVLRVAGRPGRDVVIWLDTAGAPPEPSRTTALLDQRNMQFVPRVLAVRVGTTVRMPNSDRLLHNVFSFRDGKVFDLGLYPVGTSKAVTFDKPGLSRIFCNIHPTMAAYVVAVDSPHVTVSDADGRFTLSGVAEGRYTYHTWRAGADRITGTLQVVPGRTVEIDLPGEGGR